MKTIDIEIIRDRLVRKIIGVNDIVTYTTYKRHTLLRFACEAGRFDVVQLLYDFITLELI